MAAGDILVRDGTAKVFGVSGSFSPVAAGTQWAAAITDVLTLSALANGAGRQSTKTDLGATRAAAYSVFGCVDFTGETPTSGGTVDYYWAPSTSGTAGTGNVAGNDGVDGTIPTDIQPVPSGITLAEFLRMCIPIGALTLSDDGAVQNGFVGVFAPPSRYGQLVVVNNSGDAFEADDVEAHQVLVPVIDQSQSA